MKVLLSAYACEPDKGSEPEVGWLWTHFTSEIANEVFVITRTNNKNGIESKKIPKNITFHYYDLPQWGLLLKKLPKIGVYLYYHLWQIGAALFAKRIHREEQFDLVQHITFVSILVPSYMWILKIPFIFGPVGGAETTPKNLFRPRYLGWYGYFSELLRLLRIQWSRISPELLICMKKADKILAVTNDTKHFIPVFFHHKTEILPAISYKKSDTEFELQNPNTGKVVLWVGRLIHWKGFRIFLDVVQSALKIDPTIQFRIIGTGREKRYLHRFIKKNNLKENVIYIGQLSPEKIPIHLNTASCLLLPSLHDSGGFVILEAIAQNCPVVCLETGGPGEIITNKGKSVAINVDTGYNSLISRLTDSVLLATRQSPNTLDCRNEITEFYFRNEKMLLINHIYKEVLNGL